MSARRVEVGRLRRLPDGSGLCEVRIPCDHPRLAVRLEDQYGNEFTVDYTIAYVTGPGRTIVRRREAAGEWSGQLTRTLEPVRRITDNAVYARPENLERLIRRAWRERDRRATSRPREVPTALFE